MNDFLQVTAGGLRDFDGNVDMKVRADWLVFMGHLRELGVNPQGLDYLEIGTGWYPTLPLCFSLAGARSVRTYDLTRHLKPAWTRKMVDRLEKHLPAIAEASGRPMTDVSNDYSKLRNIPDVGALLAEARIEYFAPADAAVTKLPAQSIDIVYSNSVLEHVPSEDIGRIMRENCRVLRAGGLALHSANCGDHYAYTDKRITAINYLQYPEKRWNLWQNALLYQNRLRPQDFAEIAESSGFLIERYRFSPKATLLETLRSLSVAPEFERYPPEQLCSTSVDLVLRPPPSVLPTQAEPSRR